MSPVHADEVDGAVARNTRRGAQCIGKEGTKLRLTHLARGHNELAVASGGYRMPPNPHIVGRVAESRIDTRSVADDPLQEFGIPAIATPRPSNVAKIVNHSFIPSRFLFYLRVTPMRERLSLRGEREVFLARNQISEEPGRATESAWAKVAVVSLSRIGLRL